MRTLVLVPFDRLHRNRGALRDASPDTHEILMVESAQLLGARRWHAQRLHLLLSAAEHFAAELTQEGFRVHPIRATTLRVGIQQARRDGLGPEIIATQGSSYAQARLFAELGIRTIDDDFFLTSRTQFQTWASSQRTMLMESFYRHQRRRLGILIDGTGPVGGSWNLDAENRLPPPKGAHPWPVPIRHDLDTIDRAVWQRIVDSGLDVVGAPPDGSWPTTRSGALRQLEHFLEHAFADFGPYEDAMPSETWAVNHSLLSPAMNLGLITADEIVAAALERYRRGGIPLSSCEGFIRQIIGWREYVNGVYWHFGDAYRSRNALDATRPLLPLYEDPQSTDLHCVRSVVADVQARGWVHHIPRLMVLSNLALLAGVDPQEYLDWMRRAFVDAADWVMVPNVIGMGVHADGGEMMTKPYAAGGAYLSRMGRYCGDCKFDPKKRVGDDACPFTTLYWDFLDRNRTHFATNPRMAQQVRGLDRLGDLDELRARADSVLDGLSDGRL